MSLVSVTIITRNEADRLGRALESVRWADDIVVLDSGSTDGTESVARRYTDRFYVRDDWQGYGIQKQRALELALGDWVLSLDADEAATPELRQALEDVTAVDDDIAAYNVARLNHYLGAWFGTRGWHREWKSRLLRRERVRFRDDVVHENVIINGPVRRLERGALLHWPYRDMQHHLEKINQYTTLSAVQQYERGRRSGPVRALAHGTAGFTKQYLLEGGFLYGRAGLTAAAMGGTHAFLKHAKLWALGLEESRVR